jgi:sugar phosphate isomerase/epimerase
LTPKFCFSSNGSNIHPTDSKWNSYILSGPFLGRLIPACYNPRVSNYTRRQVLAASAISALRILKAVPLSSIRLGVTTDEIDEDLQKAIGFLRTFGLHYAEIRSIWGAYNTAQPIEKIREARAMLDQHDMKTSVLGTAFFKVPLPAESAEGRAPLDKQWSLLDAACERAAILGTDKLRVFGFTYKKGEAAGKNDYPRVLELLREAARRAKARKIRLAIENVAGSYISTGAESARLLKAIPDQTVGLVWDPNNAAAAGEKPFPDGYRLLDPARIIHVHLRDYRHTSDGKVEWRPVGGGEFDNLGQLRALLKDGYKETFSLETHYKSPQGKEYASRESLTGLLKVIEQV